MSSPFDHVKPEAALHCHHCYPETYVENEGKGFLGVKYVEHCYYVCRARSSNRPKDDRSNTQPCSFYQMAICPIAKANAIIPEGKPLGGGMA